MVNNNFNSNAYHPLQTREWGEFREEWGNEVIFSDYGVITLHQIPFTPYKLGMLIRGTKPTKKMLTDLAYLGKNNNIVFVKLEPNIAYSDSTNKNTSSKEKGRLINLLKGNGAVQGKTLFTPTSFWIDLTKSEEALMNSFHSKTRYNIRLASKKGVIVKEDNSDKAFDKYIQLTKETVKRQGYYAHSEKYHRLMWEHLHANLVKKGKKPIARLLTASVDNKIVTAWILFVWKDFLYYPYGASSTEHKNLMANNLMMWEAIRLGKKLNLNTFDLWGREPGKGFTKFKEGYSPLIVEFLGTWDLIINKPLYTLYQIGEAIRWPVLRIKSKLKKPSF